MYRSVRTKKGHPCLCLELYPITFMVFVPPKSLLHFSQYTVPFGGGVKLCLLRLKVELLKYALQLTMAKSKDAGGQYIFVFCIKYYF
jgi:hypothetical protein